MAAWRVDSTKLKENVKELMKGLDEGIKMSKGVPKLKGVNEEIGPMGVAEKVIITVVGGRRRKMIQPKQIMVGVKTKRGLVGWIVRKGEAIVGEKGTYDMCGL